MFNCAIVLWGKNGASGRTIATENLGRCGLVDRVLSSGDRESPGQDDVAFSVFFLLLTSSSFSSFYLVRGLF